MTEVSAAPGSSRPSTIGLHRGAKSLIKNVMKHTETHNRLLEESEMWQMHRRMKGSKPDRNDTDDNSKSKRSSSRERSKDKRRRDRSKDDSRQSADESKNSFKDPDIHNSFLYDDRRDMRWDDCSRRGTKRAHMDDSDEERRSGAASKSTFWLRQLQKAEETDPDRWGHAGYKELYPDAFDSDRSDKRNNNHSKHKSKKQKHSKSRHKHKSISKKKKRKSLDSDLAKKKKTKKKKHNSKRSIEKKRKKHRKESTESDSSDSEIERKSAKVKHSSRTREGGSSLRTASEIKPPSQSSDSESCNEEDAGRKGGRRNMKTESEREKKPATEAAVDRYHKIKRMKY